MESESDGYDSKNGHVDYFAVSPALGTQQGRSTVSGTAAVAERYFLDYPGKRHAD